ncbi:hypothetical protein [Aquibium sp. ELW1220]|uniref:hypothetical protein n=1 Tax=Aquibium sp. ELW1220 TaxID=2976766 RepID=UPI0025B1582F|nr:hypothetical protein [Aquibium sp. ELW1220]MDN2579276.1 hypothetical protein [Aquibium sp. ELW1220]
MRIVKSLLLAAAFAASSLSMASVASATGCTGADCSQSEQSGGGCHGSKSDPVSS